MKKTVFLALAGLLSAVCTAANDDATLANRKWVRAYVATTVRDLTSEPLTLAQTVSEPLELNGTNGTFSISFVEGTNPVLRCTWSNTTNCPVGATFVWDSTAVRYRATNCTVSVAARAEVVESTCGTVTNVFLSGFDGIYDWTNRVDGSRTLLCRDGSTNVAFAVAFGRALDAEVTAIRSGLNIAEWHPSWPERILGAFLPSAYAAITQKYTLSPYQGHGDTWDALGIGDVSWSNSNGSHTFTGGGYTPNGISLDLDAWAQAAADNTWAFIWYMYKSGRTRIEFSKNLVENVCTVLDTVGFDEYVEDPANWGLRFPLIDANGVVMAKSTFTASPTWKKAVKAVKEGINDKLARLALVALAKHAIEPDKHECPKAPIGGWNWPNGCKCHYQGDSGVSFVGTTCIIGEHTTCAMSTVAQHDFRTYAWSGGVLVMSDVGCRICARCSSPLESEGAVHRMVPNTDDYDYNGCYCRYYYSAKPESESTPVAQEFERQNVTESRDLDHSGNIVVTVQSNEIKNVSLPSWDPRRNTYTVTYTRGDVQHTVKMSAASIDNINAYTHDAYSDDCWSKDGLFHNFASGRCAGVCAYCYMVRDKSNPTEAVTATAVVNGQTKTFTFSTDRMSNSTEEDHTAYSAFDWENYRDGNGSLIVVTPHCGCACGLYNGMWTSGSISNFTGNTTRDRFNRDDFCTYSTEYKVPFGAEPGNNTTQKVDKCHCYCRCAENAAAMKAKGRYHIHRPGDCCSSRCKSCGGTFSKTAVDVYAGIATATGNFSKDWRITQEQLIGDAAKYAHTPVTESMVRKWMAAYPDHFTHRDLFGNVLADTYADACSEVGCGCACRQYAGTSFEGSSDGPYRSEAAQKFHMRGPDNTKCGCACSPNSHVHFVSSKDCCAGVCAGCGDWGKRVNEAGDVIQVEIDEDNKWMFHRTSGAGTAAANGEFYCGCKCLSSKNSTIVGCGLSGQHYGEDSYLGDVAASFHSYRESTNGNESCTCLCGHGKHVFKSGNACSKICSDCMNTVADGSWSGREATDDDHTRAQGECICVCSNKVKFGPEWEVYYHTEKWISGCTKDSYVCASTGTGIFLSTNKYHCVNCNGKTSGHGNWTADIREHKCLTFSETICKSCGCTINEGKKCEGGAEDCNLCKHKMCGCCSQSGSGSSDDSSGCWGVGEDENGDGQPEAIIKNFTLLSILQDFGRTEGGGDTPITYTIEGTNVVYNVYSKPTTGWNRTWRIVGDPTPYADRSVDSFTKIVGYHAPNPTNFEVRAEYAVGCSQDVDIAGYTNATTVLVSTNTLYDAVQWIRLHSTTNAL